MLTAAIALGLAGLTSAQRLEYAPIKPNTPYDGRFTFVRLKYTTAPGGHYYRDLPAWAHGYARTDSGVSAEHQLMRILDAITIVRPRLDTNVFALDDPDLGQFPVAYMTEGGYWQLTDREARAFRAYLTKGGFVIFDDFRPPPLGGGGWDAFAANMRRILPDAQIVDLDISHPIFHAFFDINSFAILPQYYDLSRPVIRGIHEDNDPRKRLLAVINFNTDIAHYWEYSGSGFKPIRESNEAFQLGVNYVIYGLTH
jgi:hypothetical protein